ncbi:MAG: methylated-DNA--[protein]-cysteine S-methyltransferase [Actinomycetota bacterium]
MEVTHVIDSPLGDLLVVASATGLRRVDFVNAKRRDLVRPDNEHLIAATRQLGEYFAGRRREFDLVLEPRGTAFQLAAWNVLRTIPYATTITYGEQAKAMGKPQAVRAVGGANGRNPLAIIVPCHRVIGAGGKLTGYASGLDRKSWLLDHEQK